MDMLNLMKSIFEMYENEIKEKFYEDPEYTLNLICEIVEKHEYEITQEFFKDPEGSLILMNEVWNMCGDGVLNWLNKNFKKCIYFLILKKYIH